MIQPLRTIHRRAFFALAFIMPTILVVGLGARHPRTRPNAHASDALATAFLVRESNGLWQKHAIQTKFYSKPGRRQDVYVALQPVQKLNEPDLLLYWTANPPQGNTLPGDSQLVGRYTRGKAFLLPLSEQRTGYLVLFSLAHRIVFDTATVERLL